MVTARDLIEAVREAGGRLQFRPPGHVEIVPGALLEERPDLIAQLRANRDEVTRYLSREDYERRFTPSGQWARLYAYLGTVVGTPSGRGVLVQVFEDRAAVVIEGRCVCCFPGEVEP